MEIGTVCIGKIDCLTQYIDFASIILSWYLIYIDSKILMIVALIHVIPMLTVTTLLEVSLAHVGQVLREMEWLAQVRLFNSQNIDFASILLWFITCYLILDSKMLMSVPCCVLVHVIPMLTVTTLLEVSLAHVVQVSVEMEWLARDINNVSTVTHRTLTLLICFTLKFV